MIRNAQYAGSFYPGNSDHLLESIENSFTGSLGPQQLPHKEPVETDPFPFLLVPHAGYIYSGPIAAWSYLELSKYPHPSTVIILGPNHTGLGVDIGVPNKVESWNEQKPGKIEAFLQPIVAALTPPSVEFASKCIT